MILWTFDEPLAWGELDLPLSGIERDWQGAGIQPPAAYALALDPRRLWFIAGHGQAARIHPAARPGQFQAELWRHDVAELFLADRASGRYLEFNLAPNGAWWSCGFVAPRVRAEPEERALPGVMTYADLAPDGAWLAAAAIPVESLGEWLEFGADSRGNVTMILGSPGQRFLTAATLGGGEPDFHQPASFPRLRREPRHRPGE
jgi:hypothetical protein